MRLSFPYKQKPIGKAKFNKSNPFLNDMVLCMLFNEFGGERIFDYKRQTTYQFDQTNTPAWRNEGVEFNANQEHINGPDLNSILPSGSVGTALFGYKYTNLPTNYFYFFTADTYTNIALYHNKANLLSLVINGITSGFIVTLAQIQAAGNIGVTWDGTNEVCYIDGKRTDDGNSGFTIPSAAEIINIGGRNDASGRYAGGIIKWFYIWTKVLSDGEVKNISDNPYQIFGHDLFYSESTGVNLAPLFYYRSMLRRQ